MCDKANLAIKTLGENYDKSIAYYSDTIFHDTVAEKQLVGDFDKALAEKQFCMYLQPQVTSEGKLLGAEALVRWQHPKRGLIFPGDFIEVFEKMHEKINGSIIIISHQERILDIADKIVVISDGKIAAHGTKEEILPEVLKGTGNCKFYDKKEC